MPDPSLPSSLRFVVCPECATKLQVRADDAGRRGQCRQCGRIFQIALDLRQMGAKPERASKPMQPTTVTFACELCETRLTARLADVGRPVKCPDCGRRNVIPQPTAAPRPKTPAGAVHFTRTPPRRSRAKAEATPG